MTRPRVVTVLSAQGWEESFVAHARRTGTVRVVGRAYRAEDVARHRPDIAVVGTETAWLTDDVIGLWAALGISAVVVGLPDSRPGLGPVTLAGQAPAQIAAAIRDSWLVEPQHSELISVVGPHGSGATEVTCAMAGFMAPIHVIDRDEPSVSLRLAASSSTTGGVTITTTFPIETPARTLVDCGTRGPLPDGRCVLVVAHTAVSVVRAAKLIADWTGPIPELVMNMTRDDGHASKIAMGALGLEPRLLIPYDPAVAAAAACGDAPPDWFIRHIAKIIPPASGELHQ